MRTYKDYQVRTMRFEDLSFAIELAAKEGWNPGLHDADCFFSADPDGFLIGELAGEPIGCISAVSYPGDFGFLGLYIVRPEYRGKGFGSALWHAALARLRGHNIGLDGVVAQQSHYARSGFRFAYRNIRYQGRAEPVPVHSSVGAATAIPLETISNFDQQIFPARREAFLHAWLQQPTAEAYVAQENGKLVGYTVVRQCREGWKIGPLAADDFDVARHLYAAAANHAQPGEAIFIDIPAANPDARSLLTEFNLMPVFETARMYTGQDPTIQLKKLFGVTTFELG